MSGALLIDGVGRGVVVRRGDAIVAGPFHSREMAEMAIDVIERRGRQRARPCLSCGQTFMSEGPHNRMCESCKTAAHEIFTGRV